MNYLLGSYPPAGGHRFSDSYRDVNATESKSDFLSLFFAFYQLRAHEYSNCGKPVVSNKF